MRILKSVYSHSTWFTLGVGPLIVKTITLFMQEVFKLANAQTWKAQMFYEPKDAPIPTVLQVDLVAQPVTPREPSHPPHIGLGPRQQLNYYLNGPKIGLPLDPWPLFCFSVSGSPLGLQSPHRQPGNWPLAVRSSSSDGLVILHAQVVVPSQFSQSIT